MKRRLFTFVLAALTIGLLGSCSKINERIDGLDKRVYDLENAKIASIENQIAAINSSIADLGAIRQDILDLQVAVGAKGEDISELKAADEALGQRIDELKAYVGDLSKYAEKDWVTATFATLEQLEATSTSLSALEEKVNKLGETTDANIADLKTKLTNAIDSAISGINATISTLEDRVAALEAMIQSVSITPAYSDGSVEAVNGILTLKCIVSPAEAIIGMESLKDSLLIYADSVKVKTKSSPAYAKIAVGEATVLDAAQGAITLKADISEYLPKGEDKALTVAVNIKNGISDFTTEFVPVTPIVEYVEIAAKYDGSTVSTLRWYRQSLAITASGKKAWKGGSGSAVKVPGTGEDVVVGDYFQWGTFAGFYGSGADSDKGLLPYTSFTSTGCGDGSDAFTFKDGKQFNQTNAPYWSGSAYTKYNATDNKKELDASDDVASIILGGTWRMPTTKEFQALKEVTYWAWDATDKGYYVYTPNPASDAGKVNDGTGTYNKADALLFFPAAGNGYEDTYWDAGYLGDFWTGSLNSAKPAKGCILYLNGGEGRIDAASDDSDRYRGYSVRPVQDPAATYVAVTNVSLDVTAKEIEAGGNVQLKVTVAPDDATNKGVYWTSDTPAVATVDPYGKVTAVAAGTATITATTVDGNKTAPCAVTVKITTFKAIYDSDAKTLTFYYDNSLHVGEGVLYDNLPTAATQPTSWGYNGVRSNIEKVVITESVKNYSGLTSTAYMFQSMTTATNISGAEYLDVSNVTDMSFMFYNFGGGTSGSPTTLNVVPDVSKWNTGKVTNMVGMFAYYGNNSSMLDKVPDVSGWNTGKVTDMSLMFQKYGHESTSFNAVPDVSKWNTGNVTNMANIFYEYGHKSTSLGTVPDVSNWNTGKVENMQQMFYEYGKTSQNINCVLDLSGWDLSKITERHGEKVFNFDPSTFNVTIPAKTGEKSNEGDKWYYGNGTNYITPPTGKTFTPASTISTIADVLATAGDNAPSATNHWNDTKGNYIDTHNGQLFVNIYSAGGSVSVPLDRTVTPNGDNYLYSYSILSFTFNMTEGVLTSIYVDASVYGVNDTFSPAPNSALKGVFSVSDTKKVHFSQGNLWADASGASPVFYFETNQYDFQSSWSTSHVSHFFWSKDASVAYAASYSESGTAATDVFFTNATAETAKSDFTVNGVTGKYRTLSTNEWQYLFNTRTMKNGKDRYTPNITYGGKMGLVLYPDDYDNDPIHGSVETMPEGVVFLPAAGDRIGSYVYDVGAVGIYWSSSAYDEGSAYYVFLDSGSVIPDYSDGRRNGFSVRLVTEVPAAGDPGNGTEQYKNNSNPNWF